MICPNCKKEIDQDRYICPHCGSLVAVHDIEMPIFETPIYENQKNNDIPVITIDAKPSDYKETISFSNPKPINNDVYINNDYTYDYQVKPVVEEKKEVEEVKPVLVEPKEIPKVDEASLLKPFTETKENVEVAKPSFENIPETPNITSSNQNLNSNQDLNRPIEEIIGKPFSSFTPNVEVGETNNNNNNNINTNNINDIPISDKFLYEKKGVSSSQDKVVLVDNQTVGTISDIKDFSEPVKDDTKNQTLNDTSVPLEEYTKEPEVVVHMPEHPRGKLPEEEVIEKKKYSGLLILAIVLLLLAGSVFSYYLFLSSKSPTQYQLDKEFVPSITSIVGNRSVKDTKTEKKDNNIKKTYKYVNISNVTADLTNYITYLTETLEFINTTTYDLTESSGTIKLGNESKSEGYVILITITYNSNSYTITIEKKLGTLTRY